jgi:riboflavin synthase
VSAASPAPTAGGASADAEPAAWFEVSLIPETLAATTLGSLVPGDRVNLETDILARHVQRLLAFTPVAAASVAPELAAVHAAPTEGDSA